MINQPSKDPIRFWTEKNKNASYELFPPNFNVETNLNRLRKLQKSQEKGFFFLGIYSFIEGYLREKYGYGFEVDNQISLPEILSKIIDQESDAAINNIYIDISNYYKTSENDGNLKREKRYFYSANRIRHTFADQPFNSAIYNSICLLYYFSKIHNFNENETKILTSLFNHDFPDQLKQTEEQYLVATVKSLNKENASLKSQIEQAKKTQQDDADFIKKIKENDKKIKQYNGLLTDWATSYRDYYKILNALSPEQETIEKDIIDSFNKGNKKNYLILGGPGTGKTIILISILKKLKNENIYLLTYTSSLNKYNNHLAAHLSFGQKLCDSLSEGVTAKIMTFDEFLQNKAQAILDKKVYLPNKNNLKKDDNCRHLLSLIHQHKKNNLKAVTTEDILHEALYEIWDLLLNENDYITHKYSGKPLSDQIKIQERKIIWDIVKDLEKDLNNEKNIPLEYACYKIASTKTHIADEIKVKYLLVDEVQDLSNSKISFIPMIAKNNFVITGDKAQSIFIRKGIAWNYIATFIKDKNNSIIAPKALTRNFRSSLAIQDIANEFSKKLIIRAKDIYSVGFMPGPTPDFTIVSDKTTAIQRIIDRICILKQELHFNNKDFCIIAANEIELNLIIQELSSKNISSKIIEDPDYSFDDSEDIIRLNTIKYIKGIDCTAVMMLLTEDFTQRDNNGNLDKNSQMNGIYSSITRAMNSLSIFIVDTNNITTKNTSIKEFLDVLKEEAIQYEM